MVRDPSKLSVGQTVRLKKTATNYPGHDAMVMRVNPDSMIVRLKIVNPKWIDGDNPAIQFVATLDFVATAIKNPNPQPKNVWYVAVSSTHDTDLDQWDGLSKALSGTKEIWLAHDRSEFIELMMEQTNKKTGIVTRDLIVTFHGKT